MFEEGHDHKRVNRSRSFVRIERLRSRTDDADSVADSDEESNATSLLASNVYPSPEEILIAKESLENNQAVDDSEDPPDPRGNVFTADGKRLTHREAVGHFEQLARERAVNELRATISRYQENTFDIGEPAIPPEKDKGIKSQKFRFANSSHGKRGRK